MTDEPKNIEELEKKMRLFGDELEELIAGWDKDLSPNAVMSVLVAEAYAIGVSCAPTRAEGISFLERLLKTCLKDQ